MAFGSFLYRYYLHSLKSTTKYLLALYTIIFGVTEFHSHIRWRDIKKSLKPCFRNVEVGAGCGLMSFQFVFTFKKPILVLAYTYDEYKEALSIVQKIDLLKSYVTLDREDAQNLKSLPSNYFDQVLLIDVLEHIKMMIKLLKKCIKFLNLVEGLLLVFPHQITLTTLPRNLTRKKIYSNGSMRDA